MHIKSKVTKVVCQRETLDSHTHQELWGGGPWGVTQSSVGPLQSYSKASLHPTEDPIDNSCKRGVGASLEWAEPPGLAGG